MTATVLLSVLLAVQAGAPSGTAQSEPARKAEPAPTSMIDINQATAKEFAKLPGVGPKLSRRIVVFREKHGPFRRVEDLLAIRGIGHKKWRKMRPYLRLGNGANRK